MLYSSLHYLVTLYSLNEIYPYSLLHCRCHFMYYILLQNCHKAYCGSVVKCKDVFVHVCANDNISITYIIFRRSLLDSELIICMMHFVILLGFWVGLLVPSARQLAGAHGWRTHRQHRRSRYPRLRAD